MVYPKRGASPKRPNNMLNIPNKGSMGGSINNSGSKRNNLRNLYLSDDEDDHKIGGKENTMVEKE